MSFIEGQRSGQPLRDGFASQSWGSDRAEFSRAWDAWCANGAKGALHFHLVRSLPAVRPKRYGASASSHSPRFRRQAVTRCLPLVPPKGGEIAFAMWC